MDNEPRMRPRKSWDIGPPMIRMLQQRTHVRDFRDAEAVEPHSTYKRFMLPTSAPDNQVHPASSFCTRLCSDMLNKKLRCPVNSATWTPQGRRCMTGHASGQFSLWNDIHHDYDCHFDAHASSVRAMVWNHAGNMMVSADHTGIVRYYGLNMMYQAEFITHSETVRGVSFSPNDTKFVTCSDDKSLKVWDFWKQRTDCELPGHAWDVRTCDWHPTKSLIVSGGKGSFVKFWDPLAGKCVRSMKPANNGILKVSWNKNGNWLLTSSKDRHLKVFDIRMMKEFVTMQSDFREQVSVAWHPHHESVFASGGFDGSMLYWTVPNEAPMAVVPQAHDQSVWAMAWHPAGHIMATGGHDFRVKFWCRARPGDHPKTFFKSRAHQGAGGAGDDEEFDLGPATNRDDDKDRRRGGGHFVAGSGAGAGAGAGGPARTFRPPPDGYVCRICHTPGHWIQQCPEKAPSRNDGAGGVADGSGGGAGGGGGGGVGAPFGAGGGTGTCPRCGNTGHTIRECKLPSLRAPPPSYVCHTCGQPGHWKMDCPSKAGGGPGAGGGGGGPGFNRDRDRDRDRGSSMRDRDRDRDRGAGASGGGGYLGSSGGASRWG